MQNESTLDAYFAGHFDGEGYIGLTYTGQKTPHVAVRVSNIFKPTLLEYQSAFGGKVRCGNHHGRMVWTWELIERKLVARFIERLLPFSREKKSQLELAKEFISERDKHPINQCSPAFREYASTVRERMSSMKQFQYGN